MSALPDQHFEMRAKRMHCLRIITSSRREVTTARRDRPRRRSNRPLTQHEPHVKFGACAARVLEQAIVREIIESIERLH